MTATESNNLYDEWGEIPLDGVPCTLEEVSQDIADAEAEMDGFAGCADVSGKRARRGFQGGVQSPFRFQGLETSADPEARTDSPSRVFAGHLPQEPCPSALPAWGEAFRPA